MQGRPKHMMTTGCTNLAHAGRVGRWGEQACYEHLQRAAASDDSGIIIEWLNEDEEQGLPYVRCARIGLCHHLLTLTVWHLPVVLLAVQA